MEKVLDFLKNSGISYLTDEPMSFHTTFKTGGNAAVFALPDTVEQLSSLVAFCSESKTDFFTVGNGSNLLVSDEGTDRLIIHLSDGFDYVKLIDETTIEAGAGASVATLCRFALENGLSGLEFAYGIPGSVGGAAYMNAGAYGGEMKDVVISCRHVDREGKIGSLSSENADFGYRKSAYTKNGFIITAVRFKLKKGCKDEISAKMNDFIQRRKDKQPLEYPSAGSTFKRPEGYFAGALIEQSGLKGKKIGGAMVSEKHAGFIVNAGGATSSDIKKLIDFCRDTVKDKFGVTLELEVKMI